MAKSSKNKKTSSRSYSGGSKKKRSYRKKSGVAQIPAAGMTVGMVVANKDPIMNVVNNPSVDGVKTSVKYALQPDQVKKTIVHGAVGLVAGAAVKKFAPKFIKTPLGKVAKKIPKVI